MDSHAQVELRSLPLHMNGTRRVHSGPNGGGHQDPAPELRFVAPAHARSVALARQAVCDCETLPDARAGDVALVVSELFSNAVRHAGLSESDRVHMVVACKGNTIRIEVQDHGPGLNGSAPPPRSPDLGGGGYGLQIVAALSERWGSEPDGRVWAELALDEADKIGQ